MEFPEFTPERGALVAAVVAILLAEIVGIAAEFPFMVRSTLAVGAGLAAFVVVHYALTGQALPTSTEGEVEPWPDAQDRVDDGESAEDRD